MDTAKNSATFPTTAGMRLNHVCHRKVFCFFVVPVEPELVLAHFPL